MTVQSDAEKYGDAFLSVDRSIALHGRLGITEPWNEWEYPRRLAVLDAVKDVEDVQLRLDGVL